MVGESGGVGDGGFRDVSAVDVERLGAELGGDPALRLAEVQLEANGG